MNFPESNYFESHSGLWGFLALLLTAILFVSGFFGWLLSILKQIYSRIVIKLKPPAKSKIPKETLRIVPQPRGFHWSKDKTKKNGEEVEVIILSTSFYITNLTNGAIHIASTYSKNPRSESTFPMIQEPPPRAHYWGQYPILGRMMTEMKATYIVDSRSAKEGKDLHGAIIIVDQLGNEHLSEVIYKPVDAVGKNVSYIQRLIFWVMQFPIP